MFSHTKQTSPYVYCCISCYGVASSSLQQALVQKSDWGHTWSVSYFYYEKTKTEHCSSRNSCGSDDGLRGNSMPGHAASSLLSEVQLSPPTSQTWDESSQKVQHDNETSAARLRSVLGLWRGPRWGSDVCGVPVMTVQRLAARQG